MPVAFESDGGTVWCNANNNNAISLTLPATRPVGSVMYCFLFNRLITATVSTPPSGFTLLTGFPVTSATASGGRMWVYAKLVVGGETAPSVALTGTTGTSGDVWGGCIVCYSGVDTSGTLDQTIDGISAVGDASGTANCSFPTFSTTFADTLELRYLFRIRDALDTFTPGATFNEREDAATTTRTGGQFFLMDKAGTASGSRGTALTTPSNTTAARYLSMSMGLKGVQPPPPGPVLTPIRRRRADRFLTIR